MDDDAYAHVTKSKLKLKSDSGVKKKKKKTEKKELQVMSRNVEEPTGDNKQVYIEDKRTKAEVAFQKKQEKLLKERILEKAQLTHKQRVEKFNQHLDSLTEHFDIPKVSWTK